jgi:ribosome modulation factor
MKAVPTDAMQEGRKANETGKPFTACPYTATQPTRASLWQQGWDDAQIDREVWEGEGNYRARNFGEAA